MAPALNTFLLYSEAKDSESHEYIEGGTAYPVTYWEKKGIYADTNEIPNEDWHYDKAYGWACRLKLKTKTKSIKRTIEDTLTIIAEEHPKRSRGSGRKALADGQASGADADPDDEQPLAPVAKAKAKAKASAPDAGAPKAKAASRAKAKAAAKSQTQALKLEARVQAAMASLDSIVANPKILSVSQLVVDDVKAKRAELDSLLQEIKGGNLLEKSVKDAVSKAKKAEALLLSQYARIG